MSIAIHTLAPTKGAREKAFRIGRGNGSGRGTTAGRGTKGQRARSGGRNKLRLKGMKQMLLSFPKNRGFQSRYAKARVVSLVQLETLAPGTRVDLDTLRKAGFILRSDRTAKIVGTGGLTKKFMIHGVLATTTARAAVEKAGGKVVSFSKKARP